MKAKVEAPSHASLTQERPGENRKRIPFRGTELLNFLLKLFIIIYNWQRIANMEPSFHRWSSEPFTMISKFAERMKQDENLSDKDPNKDRNAVKHAEHVDAFLLHYPAAPLSFGVHVKALRSLASRLAVAVASAGI